MVPACPLEVAMFRARLATFYTLGSIIRPFLMSFCIGMIFLIIARLAITLKLTLSKPGHDFVALRFLVLWLPHYLSLCIPLSLFIGIILGFKRMVEDQEVKVMQSFGVGLHQMFFSVLSLCIASSILTIAIFGWIEPITKYNWKKLLFHLENTNVFLFVEDGTFMKIGRLTFIIKDINRATGDFGAFFSYEGRDEHGFITTTARSGRLLATGGGPAHLHLEDVTRLEADSAPGLTGKKAPPRARVSKAKVVNRPLVEQKRSYRARGQSETEWTATELINAMLARKANISFVRIIAEFHYRLGKIVLLFILPFFCFPFAIAQSRSTGVLRFGAPIITIIILYMLLDEARNYIKAGWPPLVAIWVPMGLFAMVIAYRYWRACFTVPRAS